MVSDVEAVQARAESAVSTTPRSTPPNTPESTPPPDLPTNGGVPSGVKLVFLVVGLISLVVIAWYMSKLTPPRAVPDLPSAPAVASPVDPRMPFLPLSAPDAALVNTIKAVTDASYKGDEPALALAQNKLVSMSTPAIPVPDKTTIKTARAANSRGIKAMDVGEYVAAANAFYEGKQLFPGDVEINDNLAYALCMAGKYTDALSAVADTLRLAPKRANTWATLGNILVGYGEENQAIGALLAGHSYSRAPKRMREGFVKGAMSNPSVALRGALRLTVNRLTHALVSPAMESALIHMPLEFALYFPLRAQPTTMVGAPEEFLLLNNNENKPTSDDNGYTMLFSSDINCVASACLNGAVSARRTNDVLPSGEPITLANGTKAIYQWQGERSMPEVWFVIAGIQYSFSVASHDGKTAAVDMANSALKNGPLYLFGGVSGAEPVSSTAAIPPTIPRTGYARNSPMLNTRGLSTFTFDNVSNTQSIMVKLYRGASEQAARSFYVMAGESFKADNLDAGIWTVRYLILPDGDVYEANPMELTETDEGNRTLFSNMRFTLSKSVNGDSQLRKISKSKF